ncbi:hypothetical protein [Nocardia fluminea]|uniref:hypothetical protein n=1 Tax=Nocardia fluminea TaxID=134984 RepID=UPI003661B09A
MNRELALTDQQLGHELAQQLADDRNPPAAWQQRDDGWYVVDEYGIAWPVAAFGTRGELHADVQAVLGAIGDPVDVTPLSVADTEVDR